MKKTVLVTGGNGFLALWLIKGLLRQGYAVRATLRSESKAAEVTAALTSQGLTSLTDLHFVEANLTKDAGWAAAMQDVETVMSVAAPVFVNGESVADQVVQTAKQGTLRILKAAEQAGVKRVVMTANLGAVGFSRLDHQGVVTEQDWTNPDQPGLSLYEKSKLLAEQAAWNFSQNSKLDLVTVNAGAMLGAAMGQHVSGSFGLVQRLLTGQVTPNFKVNVVAAQDVAAMHILAMQTPNAAGQRFLAVADQAITAKEIMTLIKTQRPAQATQLPKLLLPTPIVRLLAPVMPQIKEVNLMMRVNHQVSNRKARTILGWQPKSSAAETVLAAVDSLTTK
ncbi:NAD-dependent dehydratase [Lactiplantibacillus brownii]